MLFYSYVAIKLTFKYSDRHINIMLCGDVVATHSALVATCGDVATIYPPLERIESDLNRLAVIHQPKRKHD